MAQRFKRAERVPRDRHREAVRGLHAYHVRRCIVSPEIATGRLVRAAVVELVRDALARSPGAAGATRELLRVADGAHIEGELVDVLRAALALVGGAS